MDLAGAVTRGPRPAAGRWPRRGARERRVARDASKTFATNCASRAMCCCCIFGRRSATWCVACFASRKTDADRLALEVARFSRPRPDHLEFVSAPASRAPGRVLREQFCARFRDLLARQFPDDELASLTAAADLKHSLSGNYARGILRADSRAWAVLGAAPGENAATYDGLLTFGLLWLSRARQLARGQVDRRPAPVLSRRARAASPHTACKRCRNRAWSRCMNTTQRVGARGAWIRPIPAISTLGWRLAARSTRFWRKRARRSNRLAA